MFTHTSDKRSQAGASQSCSKDMTRPGSKAKKKTLYPEVTLPPLCPEPSSHSAASPLFSRTPKLRNVPSDRPFSVVELARLAAQLGPGRAVGDTQWKEGPRLMASALGADIPVTAADEPTAQSRTEKDGSIKVTTCKEKKMRTVKKGKVTKLNKVPLTGTEVFHMFAQRDLGELEFHYLKEVDGDSYRPYDLRVVHSREAGPEHYVFSPKDVLHVTDRGYGGLVSLAEWHRESVSWKALQEIPFFRDFRLRKAFTRWQRNVHKVLFQRKCKDLQDMLVIAVPQFRNALFQFTRVIEEVRGTQLLPQNESKTYTLLEFKNVLKTMNQECLQILEKLSRCRAVILNAVKEDSYKAHQELQLHMEYAKKPNKCYEPIHLHLARQQQLKRDLARSESILQKLGNFAALINQMTVQSLVPIVRQDILSFLDNVVKKKKPEQCCLFHTELCFGADSQLKVDPPVHLFQQAVSEALIAVGDSIIQMCDSCGFFLKISNSGFTCDVAQDLTSDFTCLEHATLTGENKNNDGMAGHQRFGCWRVLRDESVPLLWVQGNWLRGCYYPLSKKQLEWQISTNDVTKRVEKEQAKIMQEAEEEIQQLCESYSWLVDTHLFISQWSATSLESMKGQPALLCEEHIKKVRLWTKRMDTVPSSVSTSNQLFSIQCSHVRQRLGQQLTSIEEEVLQQLTEQIKLRSERLISDMERPAAELQTVPTDLHSFSKYAVTMRESVKLLPDMQKRLEYIHSLQDTGCMNMTEQEETLKEKMQTTWDCFKLLLNQARSVVDHHRPLKAEVLDKLFSFVACDLKNVICKATSGPFLDPMQNAKEIVPELKYMCLHVHSLFATLEQLSRDSQNLHEHPLDLTMLTTDVQKVDARKQLWELIAVYTTWMEEWKQLDFSEDVVSQAQRKIATWKEQVFSLTSIIPAHDAVLQKTLGILESLSRQAEVMAKLQSPTLKHRHLKAIFEGMGLLYVPEKKVTVADVVSQQLEVNQKQITKICLGAQVECNIEQTFQKLRQGWKTRLFQLDKFTLPVWRLHEKPMEGSVSNLQTASYHSSTFTIIGLEVHSAEVENDLMALSTMMKSPHSAHFRLQVEDCMQTLQDLGKLLSLFERYQQVWAYLTKIFHESHFSVQRVDLLEQFQPVDDTFKEMMHSISSDPHVLNFVHSKKTNNRFQGNSLCQILIDGLSLMEVISNQMVNLLETLCEQFPRLWFLSDREVSQLLSFHPTPFTLQHFVCKCFKGIRRLQLDCEIPTNTRGVKSCVSTSHSHRQMKVLGFFGSLQEHVTFPTPLEPNRNALIWLCGFEKHLKLTMKQHIKQCAVVRNQLEPSSQDLAYHKDSGDTLLHIAERRKMSLPVLDLLSEYPLQCLLVAEEVVWCKAVLQAFQQLSPVKLSNLKVYNSAKLNHLSCVIRDGVSGAKSESLVSKYTMTCLHALVQGTMKHAQQLSLLMEVQCVLESSFEWLSLMKYHINSEDWSVKADDDPSCYMDVFGHRLQYDYEYFGPEDWAMVHTPSTDRAMLGLLLALTSYRCGFVSGPSMSGKKTTVVQLGKALGRQVVTMQCCPSMRAGVVQKLLLGALQTGAWLLLASVDLLKQGVLSFLGQHVVDIHQSFSEFTKSKNQRVIEEPKDMTAVGITGCKVDSGCYVVLAGKRVSASLSYGCVLISSKGHTSVLPESLRCATRPIALTNPDYRIIAEVLLTCIGFTEAMSLSQRLVALLSLAKETLCLPDSISDNQSYYLVVLKKIISASEIHLQQTVRQQETSDKAKLVDAEQTDLAHNVTAREKQTENASRSHSCHSSIMRGIMEETAIVKAILSVLSPVLYEHKKASQFYILFTDTFPSACQFPLFQQYMEEEEKMLLNNAVTEELRRNLFHCDGNLIKSAVSLYQTLKFSQAVMLIGPSGSGKTTCHRALAGALNHLAVEYLFENDTVTPQISAATVSSVDTLVLFPNAMSHEEMFGCFCEKRGWQDGAVAKVLRNSGRDEAIICNNKKKSDQTPVRWLVMDGNPAGHPSWLDHLTTICCPEESYLCLSSGETLPSQSNLKLLMEVTDLRDASPSAVTHCSLVYFTGTDLWKAVWKTQIDALSFEHKVDQVTLKMWNCLAEDLFSSTLSAVRQNALTSAIHNEGESLNVMYGLQEIMSFFRILRALLQHCGKDMEKAASIPQTDKKDIPLHRTGTAGHDPHTKLDWLPRNLFLVAYIWGFSGPLHPRHRPQFDSLARQVLFNSQYKIVVPDEESVFEHFFDINSKIFSKNTLLTNSISPKYGKYGYLLDLMLEANQPVLLVGEPASGKTTVCKTLLSFDKPHISLATSPLLASRDLRTILDSISCRKNCQNTKLPGLLLFLDDLQEAPCDVFGKTSAVLETLRQSISMGHILTFDSYNFKLLPARTISYMATCCVFGSGSYHSNTVSSRLSRLFSIFVLPSLSMDVILSIHSPRITMWLKEMPLMRSIEDMACCIITATTNLYHAICDQFQPTVQRHHFIFSHHDLQKVFSGMCLWQPGAPGTGTEQKQECSLPSVLNIARLWMHECMRTFSDRLCSEDESKTLVSLIAKTAETHYGSRLVDETQPTLPEDTADTWKLKDQSLDTLNLPQEPQPASQSDLKKGQTWTESVLLSGNTGSNEASLKTNLQILQHKEDMMTKLIFGPELSDPPMDQHHSFKCSSSYQYQDLDGVVQELCALMDRKQEDKKVDSNDSNMTTRFIVHRQSASRLLRILRVLLIPGGHGVLIGSDRGTGRKTTVRLAACVTGHQLMEVHPANENKLHEILKEAGNQTKVGGVNVIILVHEGISQSVREELLVAMAHRTYPGLYTDEELRNLVSRVTAGKKSRRYVLGSWMFDKHLAQIHRNVHVFLLLPLTTTDNSEMSANDEPCGWNPQLTKALSSSCCVEVYQPWSRQTLLEVAAQCLKTSSHIQQREGSEASLYVAMAGIHQSARQYASVLLRAQPFSAQTYLEFIAHFGSLCDRLHKQQQSQANRVATVLSHLDVMKNTAMQYKQREKEHLRAADHLSSLLEEVRHKCVEEENRVHHFENQINHVQKQMGPVFVSGLEILNCLNPSDIEEVRHYRDPPDRVVKILDAICLLFNRPPGWESAKQLLGQSNFFQELEFFDRSNVTDEQLQQLGQIVHSPQFVPESVLEVSKACESLCRWVQAVYECCSMRHLRLLKTQLEEAADETRGQLHLVKLQLQLVGTELEKEVVALHTAESSRREAAAAVGQLETRVTNWRAAAQEAELNYQNLLGDALILAAIISYLGPFGPDIRTELLSKWRELCQTGSININPKCPITSLFTHADAATSQPPLSFPIHVSERVQLPLSQAFGLSHDAPSARTVVKLLLWGCSSAWVRCWPLLADSQQPLHLSCLHTGENAKLEKETECGLVVCADDPELLDKLDQAAEEGLKVLVTQVERATPSPQFLARLVRSAGCCLPGFKQQLQPTHPDFCLFLSTHLPAQLLHTDIHPSILAQVCVVDLSLSSDEIQELMLTQLLQSERKTLLSRHLQFQNDKQLLQERLMAEEDALMDYILQSNTSLLQDPAFLPRVAVCEDAVERLQAEILQLSEELEHHKSLLAPFRPLVRLAEAFYQALQEVSRLSSTYYFSLRCFITVIQEAFIVKDRPLVSGTNWKVPGGVIAEVINRMVAQLLVQYRPCLFKSHVPVLELLLSVALLQHNQLCSEAERVAFLRGLQHIQHPVSNPAVLESTSALPSWIPLHILPELLCLEEIPVFRGLIASLSTCSVQWQEYLHLPSSTVVGAVPCHSHRHLSLFQRALLWKTLLPSCLEGLAKALAAYHLCLPGQTAGTLAPHTGNPEALSRCLIKHEGPIILTLDTQRGETWKSIQPLGLINSLAHRAAGTNQVEVKVVSCGASCDTDVILSMLDQAVNDGHWLVFNNCHLLERWNDNVVAHLSQLISASREEQRFRLWFITQESASRSIPDVVRACALPLVCDSPWDLKEELSSSLQQLGSAMRCQSLSAVTADDMELLHCCAVFHSVLLQRQTFKHLGQGRIYGWSEEDLLALVDAHFSAASLCQDKAQALQYIAVNLVHGGHVLDSADLEVVGGVAKTCFSRASPLLGSGPHILSDITSRPGHFDSSEVLHMLYQGLQDPANITDPHVMGFSADVAADMIKIKSHDLNRLLQASQTPVGAARSLHIPYNQAATLPAYSHTRDRLQALNNYLAHKNLSTGALPRSHFLCHFLQAEWEDLIELVSSLLSQLQQPGQFRVPTFASLLKLTSLSRLERRAELLSSYLWHQNTSDPPSAYRPSAFKNARGFLVAVMREAARVNCKYISDIALHLQVLSETTYPPSLPLDAVYLCGLQLRGASWDTQLGALQDAVPLQPCSLPLVCVRAQVRSTNTATDTFPGRRSHLNGASPWTPPQVPLYYCPLYLDGETGISGLADVNILTTFPLPTQINPVLCSLRRVRLVSEL